MHRNTYIVVSILAVLAALVVGVNVGKKLSPTPPAVIPTPTMTASLTPTPSLETFVDATCGFSLQYTSDFSLMDSASGSAILSYANDKSKSIAMTCQKNIPRPAIPADKIDSLTIAASTGASVSAKLYHDQSSQDGTPLDVVIFTHPTRKLDIFIAGYGDAFNAIIKTIQIIP